MRKRELLLGASIGIAIGYLLKTQLDSNKKVTAEQALSNAKELFQKSGPISGSWIYMKPEEVKKNGLTYNAYRGGITRNIDGVNKQYEFYVDVDTGGVIASIETSA